jgi:outer membrane immunogenic protein
MERKRDRGVDVAASGRFLGEKMKVPAERNGVVAALLQSRNKCETASHEATKLPPRCLIDVTSVNNGELLMRKLLLGAAACIVFAAPAFAADLPARTYTKAPVYKAPELVYNWTGFYIGGHIGGGFGGNNSLEGSNGQFLGGVQGGADYQFASNWVIGAEAQYSWLTGNNGGSATFPLGTTVTGNTQELGSVTGRIGYTWGPALLYAKGGYAWRDGVSVSASNALGPVGVATDGTHRDGYTVGGGLEYMFAPNWSVKAEYLYYNFGNTTINAGPADVIGARFREDEHTFKLGVNYRFGWGGPVAARY